MSEYAILLTSEQSKNLPPYFLDDRNKKAIYSQAFSQHFVAFLFFYLPESEENVDEKTQHHLAHYCNSSFVSATVPFLSSCIASPCMIPWTSASTSKSQKLVPLLFGYDVKKAIYSQASPSTS